MSHGNADSPKEPGKGGPPKNSKRHATKKVAHDEPMKKGSSKDLERRAGSSTTGDDKLSEEERAFVNMTEKQRNAIHEAKTDDIRRQLETLCASDGDIDASKVFALIEQNQQDQSMARRLRNRHEAQTYRTSQSRVLGRDQGSKEAPGSVSGKRAPSYQSYRYGQRSSKSSTIRQQANIPKLESVQKVRGIADTMVDPTGLFSFGPRSEAEKLKMKSVLINKRQQKLNLVPISNFSMVVPHESVYYYCIKTLTAAWMQIDKMKFADHMFENLEYNENQTDQTGILFGKNTQIGKLSVMDQKFSFIAFFQFVLDVVQQNPPGTAGKAFIELGCRHLQYGVTISRLVCYFQTIIHTLVKTIEGISDIGQEECLTRSFQWSFLLNNYVCIPMITGLLCTGMLDSGLDANAAVTVVRSSMRYLRSKNVFCDKIVQYLVKRDPSVLNIFIGVDGELTEEQIKKATANGNKQFQVMLVGLDILITQLLQDKHEKRNHPRDSRPATGPCRRKQRSNAEPRTQPNQGRTLSRQNMKNRRERISSIRQLQRIHHRKGVKITQYLSALHAILCALQPALGNRFDELIRDAWAMIILTQIIQPLTSSMLETIALLLKNSTSRENQMLVSKPNFVEAAIDVIQDDDIGAGSSKATIAKCFDIMSNNAGTITITQAEAILGRAYFDNPTKFIYELFTPAIIQRARSCVNEVGWKT